MKNVNQLFRVINEVLFVLVGGLLLLFGLTGRYLFDPRRPQWLVLAVVLIFWGLRTWRKAAAIPNERAVMKIGGASLMAVGAIMISLAWAPFHWAGWLISAAGIVFALRGLASAIIAVRSA